MRYTNSLNLYSNKVFASPAMSVGPTSFVATRPDYQVARATAGLANSMEKVMNFRYKQQLNDINTRYKYEMQSINNQLKQADENIKLLSTIGNAINQGLQQAINIQAYKEETNILAQTSDFISSYLNSEQPVDPQQFENDWQKYSQDVLKNVDLDDKRKALLERKLMVSYLDAKNKLTAKWVTYQAQETLVDTVNYLDKIAENTTDISELSTAIVKAKTQVEYAKDMGILNPIRAEKMIEDVKNKIVSNVITYNMDKNPDLLAQEIKNGAFDEFLSPTERQKVLKGIKTYKLKQQKLALEEMRINHYMNFREIENNIDQYGFTDLRNMFNEGKISYNQYVSAVREKSGEIEDTPENSVLYHKTEQMILNGAFGNDDNAVYNFAKYLDENVNDLTPKQRKTLMNMFDKYTLHLSKNSNELPPERKQYIKDIQKTITSMDMDITNVTLGNKVKDIGSDLDTFKSTANYIFIKELQDNNYFKGLSDDDFRKRINDLKVKAMDIAMLKLTQQHLDDQIDSGLTKFKETLKSEYGDVNLNISDKTRKAIYDAIYRYAEKYNIVNIDDNTYIKNVFSVKINGKVYPVSIKYGGFVIEK